MQDKDKYMLRLPDGLRDKLKVRAKANGRSMNAEIIHLLHISLCRTLLPIASFPPPEKEAVDHPSHYGGADNPYEVIKVLENWLTRDEFIGALKFNIIKYQARAWLKAGGEDYDKAAWYAAYLSDFLKRNPA